MYCILFSWYDVLFLYTLHHTTHHIVDQNTLTSEYIGHIDEILQSRPYQWWCAAAALLLFHTPQSVETRNSQKLPREKNNFRSWRKQDKLQIVSFKFNLNILVMFIFSFFMNYSVFVIAMSEFCLLFLTKIDFKPVFSAFSFSNGILHCMDE